MKIKNLTNRNINILGKHNKAGGLPYRVKVIAGSSLELDEEEFSKIKAEAGKLKEAGVVLYTITPVSQLTVAEIIAKVKLETEVDLPKGMNKAGIQAKAEALGVEV